jgi:hypothetical protein
VAGGCGYVVYIQAEENRGDDSALRYTSPHDTTCGRGCLEGRLERTAVKVSGYDFKQVRWEVEDAFYPHGVEGFSHVLEKWTCLSPLVKVSVASFNRAGQLQRRAVLGSEPKTLVAQQPTHV